MSKAFTQGDDDAVYIDQIKRNINNETRYKADQEYNKGNYYIAYYMFRKIRYWTGTEKCINAMDNASKRNRNDLFLEAIGSNNEKLVKSLVDKVNINTSFIQEDVEDYIFKKRTVNPFIIATENYFNRVNNDAVLNRVEITKALNIIDLLLKKGVNTDFNAIEFGADYTTIDNINTGEKVHAQAYLLRNYLPKPNYDKSIDFISSRFYEAYAIYYYDILFKNNVYKPHANLFYHAIPRKEEVVINKYNSKIVQDDVLRHFPSYRDNLLSHLYTKTNINDIKGVPEEYTLKYLVDNKYYSPYCFYTKHIPTYYINTDILTGRIGSSYSYRNKYVNEWLKQQIPQLDITSSISGTLKINGEKVGKINAFSTIALCLYNGGYVIDVEGKNKSFGTYVYIDRDSTSQNIDITINKARKKKNTGTLKDSRDGKLYKTIWVGNKVWMTENLDFNSSPEDSWAYYPNHEEKGRLYEINYLDNNKVCPSGWHIPTVGEFEELISYVRKTYRTPSDKNSLDYLDALYEGGASGINFQFSGQVTKSGKYKSIEKKGHYKLFQENTYINLPFSIINVHTFQFSKKKNAKMKVSVRCVKN